MEEEEKVPPTSEPNPNGEDEVNVNDLEDEGKKGSDPAEEGKEADPTDPEGQKGEGKPNPKQSRETDAANAERRRKAKEREEKRQREREEEIRRQAVFEVKSGQVSADELRELGLSKVEDEDQLFLVESLRKAKADGSENPQATAYQALFRKQSAEKAEAKANEEAKKRLEEQQRATVAADQKAFLEKYGKTTAEVMKTDKEFMALFGSLIDPNKGNFTELYTAFTTMKSEQKGEAKKQGAFPTGGSKSQEDGQAESDEDFKKRWIAQHGHW